MNWFLTAINLSNVMQTVCIVLEEENNITANNKWL